jgi:hypothetical protein
MDSIGPNDSKTVCKRVELVLVGILPTPLDKRLAVMHKYI